MTYEEKAKKLEALVAEIESGNLSFADYKVKAKEAVALIDECKKELHIIDAELQEIFSKKD